MPTPTPQPDIECKDVEYETETIIYYSVGADGDPIEICNYPNVQDPSWGKLQEFLLQDKTAQIPYQDGVFVCADYAERLHNNAEAAGIRAACVSIHFYNSEIGHALNAFFVTGMGLVYIDVTKVGGIDCPSDCIVTLEEGAQIESELLFCTYESVIPDPSIVELINIVW